MYWGGMEKWEGCGEKDKRATKKNYSENGQLDKFALISKKLRAEINRYLKV